MNLLSKYPALICVWMLVYSSSVLAAKSDDGCGPWLMADPASAEGTDYLTTVKLRSCELSRGVTAFLQFQNTTNDKITLGYKVHTSAEWPKEGEVTLSPGDGSKRAGTCQACTLRKGGIKSWEIISLSAEAGPPVEESPVEEVATPAPELATEQEPSAKGPEPSANKQEPSAERQELPAKKEPAAEVKQPATEKKQPVAKEPEPVKAPPAESTEKPVEPELAADEPAAEPDGLVTEDGKVIPWDQVPIEFRPKDKR